MRPMRMYDDYFEALVNGRAQAVTELVDQALLGGTPPVDLIRDVIALAQHQVGEGWADGWLSIADEHVATAAAEQALAVVAHSLPSASRGRTVVLACPEGEWHSMPARLACEQARAAGLHVTMLGASMPAEHLHAYLLSTGPDAVALSVTLASNLVAAGGSIQAAHRAGVPVIVGGAAWGTDGSRAGALGADEWLSDVRCLAQAVERVNAQPALALSPPLGADARVLAEAPRDLATRALERHTADRRWPTSLTAQQAQDRLKDYRWLMKHTAAALACGDLSIVDDMLCWWAHALARQGFDPRWAGDACQHLAAVADAAAPAGAVVLREVAERRDAGGPDGPSAGTGGTLRSLAS